jgi:hypothetical protein
MRTSNVFGVAAVWVLFAACPGLASAADPVRGFELFQLERHGPCGRCHGDPRNNKFRILNGANNPRAIAAAAIKIGAPPSPQRELDDLAAYLGTYVAGPIITPPADPVMAVEYFHAEFNHYFVTILPAELAALDSGTQSGWTRTGKRFYAWKSAADAPAAASPVCRFYIPPAQGDSHFYSASPAECATVDAQFPTFDYESPEVMYVLLPDAATGACPGVTAPVFRLWNDPASRGRTDNNHRFTTDTTTWEQMLAAGSVREGYGPNGVGMCAPIPLLKF